MSTYKNRTDRAWKMVHQLIDCAGIQLDDTAKTRAAAVLHRELYLHDEAARKRTRPRTKGEGELP